MENPVLWDITLQIGLPQCTDLQPSPPIQKSPVRLRNNLQEPGEKVPLPSKAYRAESSLAETWQTTKPWGRGVRRRIEM